jgi:hypothetical protein
MCEHFFILADVKMKEKKKKRKKGPVATSSIREF